MKKEYNFKLKWFSKTYLVNAYPLDRFKEFDHQWTRFEFMITCFNHYDGDSWNFYAKDDIFTDIPNIHWSLRRTAASLIKAYNLKEKMRKKEKTNGNT